MRPTLQIVALESGIGSRSFSVDSEVVTIGAADGATVRLRHFSINPDHAEVRWTGSEYTLKVFASAPSTFVNDLLVDRPVALNHGDRVRFGTFVVLTLEIHAPASALRHAAATKPTSVKPVVPSAPWHPDSWRDKPVVQAPGYADAAEVARAESSLRKLPPLVTSWEVEHLKSLIAEAQEGRRFLLQGGDCAETFSACEPDAITRKLKILMQMSIVLLHGAKKPVIRVGRLAGQYAKPRSSPIERRGDIELPSYLGDLVNRPEFTAEARRPDPSLLLSGYHHSAMTLNFMRALSVGGFSDLRRADYFDLSVFERADLPSRLREEYHRMSRQIAEGLNFVRALGDRASNELTRTELFTSHEALNLHYESAQTRSVPRNAGYYNLTTHLPWLGERTRGLDGAHIEYFRGIANPVGVKVGPKTTPEDLIALIDALNPTDQPGKLILIIRLGAKHVATKLPPLVEAVSRARRRVLWVCDPMHGNGITTQTGLKTRNFDDILEELEASIDVHDAYDSVFGGVHFELTGEDVTECLGGGVSEADLDTNYVSACDPRLNYRQSMELAFCVARRMGGAPSVRRPSTIPPPY